jgi:hypothetical protein
MGRLHDTVDGPLADWILRQPVFFVATAPLASDGHVNCSPKGNRGELAVTGARQIAYVDQTGSGVETIAHLRENGRIVVMLCSFEGPPRIVRLHGTGKAVLRDDEAFGELVGHFAGQEGDDGGLGAGIRSIVVVEVRRISDSCGYGVPLMDFGGHRDAMDDWSRRKGEDGIRAYWQEKNTASLDGLPGVVGAT